MDRHIEEELSEEIRVEEPPEAPPQAEPPPPPSPEALLAAQFKGKKAELRPLYEGLVHIAKRLHPKVKLEPTANAVRFVARRPFAVFRATSSERADVGLALGDLKPTGRLRACKALGGVEGITHRIELYSPRDLDAALVRLMKLALEAPSPMAAGPQRTEPAKRPKKPRKP